MAQSEFETKWAAAATSTTPDGATATLLLLIAGVATQVLPNNLSVGKVRWGTVASAGATGVQGEIRHDANYIYRCTATNTWVRLAGGSTW